MKLSKTILVLTTFLVMAGSSLFAQTETPKLYDEKQDVKSDINKALAIAKKDGKHVLLQIGGNW